LNNFDFFSDMISNYNGTEVVGCPVDDQPWCAFTPVMTIVQFLLGYFLTSIGYPIGITVIQTLFSKILGPRPQVRFA
jgi:MFS transporter, ceroid-lipofuscinosis neuronal protein 7